MNRGVARVFIVSATLSLAITRSALAGAVEWPKVRPLKVVKTFVRPGYKNSDTPLFAYIRTVAGARAYKIECHNGNYDNESEMNFSGEFQCALFALRNGVLVSGNLFAANVRDELSTDWWNRGRMRSAQLRGECLRFPDYSTNRIFELRGMRIILRFSDFEWNRNKDSARLMQLQRFTVSLIVKADGRALTPRAQIPRGPRPPASCYP